MGAEVCLKKIKIRRKWQ